MTPLHTVIFLALVVWGRCVVISSQESEHVEGTSVPVSQQAERRMSVDVDDSLTDGINGMASYSSVVIHHPVASTHTGHQPTTQWIIDDHKSTGSQLGGHTEHQPPVRQSSQRQHRHHARISNTANQAREEVTMRPESLSTAQSFFRLRGYKSKTKSNHEESPDKEDTNSDYENMPASAPQYTKAGPLAISNPPQSAPHGMSDELMNALLSQHPQTFEYGYKSRSDEERTGVKSHESHTRQETTSRPSRKPQKKYKNQVQTEAAEKAKKRVNNKNRDSFNVGYSIGFGGQTATTDKPSSHHTPNDVVLGKPKSHNSPSNYKLHVNGENSVWKEIHPGVEMSEDTIKNSPLSLTIPEKHIASHYYQTDPETGILSGHPGQGVYYLNGISQDYNVPTIGQATFDHAHALGQSNTFDFSNAVSHPLTPVLSNSPQSKQDNGHTLKSPKQLQSSQISKQYNNHPSYQVPSTPQKSAFSYASQPFSYIPYSLDSIKPTSSLNSKSSSDYVAPSGHATLKSSKHQQAISPSGLGGGYDLSNFMGFGTPVPIQNVYIPGKKDGEGQMVPAIVIPISQLSGFDNFGSGLNYINDGTDGYQGFGGDVFNVLPEGATKDTLNSLNPGKYSSSKPSRNHDKPTRSNKGSSHGVSSHVGLSAPEHLDGPPRSSHPKHHPRPESHRPFSGLNQKPGSPKFSSHDNFRDSPTSLKRSPSNRSARLAQLQSELNSILAEEMLRKNRPSRRLVPSHPVRVF